MRILTPEQLHRRHVVRVKMFVTIAVTCALIAGLLPVLREWSLHINIAANMLWIWLE